VQWEDDSQQKAQAVRWDLQHQEQEETAQAVNSGFNQHRWLNYSHTPPHTGAEVKDSLTSQACSYCEEKRLCIYCMLTEQPLRPETMTLFVQNCIAIYHCKKDLLF